MTELELTITLLSDAELGTGFGTEAVNSLLPRDARGQPIIPASHLKGLLRERVEALKALRDWPDGLVDALFGEPGENGEDGQSSRIRVSGAVCETGEAKIITIARTALGRYGVAAPGSLRTVEAISAGTTFTGRVWVDDEPGGTLDLLTRLALMSMEALGGGRTRGAGLCCVRIAGERRLPGPLLRQVEALLRSTAPPKPSEAAQSRSVQAREFASGSPHWLRLVFRADSAVCCPEIPINGSTNHVRSGPVIPASAVQGAILARLDGLDPALASACFADARFRAWPLLPVLGAEDVHDDVPFGVRVDLTHRLSKLPMEGGGHDVRDTAIKPYHWSEVAGGSPLKSSDGILRRHPDGTVTLWKAADMPRLITSHSVHLGSGPESKRSLFSVEALAPMVFSGLLAIPAEAAEAVRQALSSDPTICFGKARSIRGSGRLEVHPADPLADLLSGRFPDKPPGCVFVVQSPLLLPDDYQVGRAETALQYLAERAGWGTALLDCEETSGQSIARTAATCGIRFGWNRHGLGAKADERHRRLQAHRVILPGSVLVLRTPLTDTAAKLLAGLGDGRESGFGALLPHPGMAASEPYRPRRPPVTLGSRDEAGRRALLLFTTAGKADGPSPSQISAVGRRIGKGADAYLDKQAGRGGVRHWHRWEPVFGDVKQVLCGDPDLARRVLRAWQDLAIIHRGTDKERRS